MWKKDFWQINATESSSKLSEINKIILCKVITQKTKGECKMV
jgi:hypothetical protein